MHNIKVLQIKEGSSKELKELEKLLNMGWELDNESVEGTDSFLIYILRSPEE